MARSILRPLLPLFFMLPSAGCALQRQHLSRDFHFVRYRLMPSPWTMRCGDEGAMSWCLFAAEDPALRDKRATIWYFHYATGDAKSLARLGLVNALYRGYLRKGRLVPRVISVSYGTHWVFSDRPGKRQTVSTSEFLAKTMPALEARLGGTARNFLWGMSQGSYNALEILLAKPERWQAAALSCPALYSIDPFGPGAAELAGRTGAPLPSVVDGMALFDSRLGDAAAWAAEEPIARIKTAADPPPILIQANLQDEFGFLEGDRALADALKARGDSVFIEEEPGGHCINDVATVGEFLAAQGKP